jgi:hypothetical protein
MYLWQQVIFISFENTFHIYFCAAGAVYYVPIIGGFPPVLIKA